MKSYKIETLTPVSYYKIDTYYVQATTEEEARTILEDDMFFAEDSRIEHTDSEAVVDDLDYGSEEIIQIEEEEV